MKLENVTAEVRPRGRWESIDFGCALVRESFSTIVKVLLVTIIPVWFLLWVVLRDVSPFWLFLGYWMTLPLASRAILYVLSRKLFGDSVSVKEVFLQWPRMVVRRFFHAVLIWRFSPSRSLALSVSELEGLKGKAYRDRVQLLERNGGDGAAQTAMIGWLLIMVAAVGVFILLQILLPLSIDLLDYESDFLWEEDGADLLWSWLVGLYAVAVLFVEPFCVGAGFAMYVNSRTITEGWDIELAFKRMSSRLNAMKQRSGIGLLLIGMLSLGLMSSHSRLLAATEPEEELVTMSEEQKLVHELYQHEDFKVHTKTIQVLDEDVEENKELSDFWDILDFGGNGILSLVFKLFLYILVLVIVVGLIVLIARNFHVFQGKGNRVKKIVKPKQRVQSVMGMNVTKESLPEDIVSAALAAWERGDAKLALSLLYRGAISWSVDSTSVELRDSDTERDCILKLEAISDCPHYEYFKDLTEAWLALAYGKVVPEHSFMHSLCTSWPYQGEQSKEEAS